MAAIDGRLSAEEICAYHLKMRIAKDRSLGPFRDRTAAVGGSVAKGADAKATDAQGSIKESTLTSDMSAQLRMVRLRQAQSDQMVGEL